MAAMGVAAGRILTRGFGPRVVRAGRLAQPAREKLCAASARKALPRLAKQLGLALPPIQMRVPSCRQQEVQGPSPDISPMEVAWGVDLVVPCLLSANYVLRKGTPQVDALYHNRPPQARPPQGPR